MLLLGLVGVLLAVFNRAIGLERLWRAAR